MTGNLLSQEYDVKLVGYIPFYKYCTRPTVWPHNIKLIKAVTQATQLMYLMCDADALSLFSPLEDGEEKLQSYLQSAVLLLSMRR
jgi:hypothetical protein